MKTEKRINTFRFFHVLKDYGSRHGLYNYNNKMIGYHYQNIMKGFTLEKHKQ
jgi:hypothetical protein